MAVGATRGSKKRSFQSTVVATALGTQQKETPSFSTAIESMPARVPFEKIRKNPLNVGNEKSPEMIDTLKKSIEASGLLTPPVVYKQDDGTYMLIAGEGRISAIEEIRAEKKDQNKTGFDEILVTVRRKPVNIDEEKMWILSDNTARNTVSLEQYHKNIRELCLSAKRLSEQGVGTFNQMIESMSVLGRTSIFKYTKINEKLEENFLRLFDEEKISLNDAVFLCNYSKLEQKVALEHFLQQGDDGKFDRKIAEVILKEHSNNAGIDFKEGLEAEVLLSQKAKEEINLQRKLDQVTQEQEDLKFKLEEANPEEVEKLKRQQKRADRKKAKQEEQLKNVQQESEQLQEKIKAAENTLPTFNQQETVEASKRNEISVMLSSIVGNVSKLNQMITEYNTSYGVLPENLTKELEAAIEIFQYHLD